MSNYVGNVQSAGDLSRGEFVKASYKYLIGAILAFAVISAAFYVTGFGVAMVKAMGAGKYVWLAVLGGFMVVSWFASHIADTSDNPTTQLLALGGFTLAEALLFAPIFAIAGAVAPGAISTAVFATALLVGGLTWTAMTIKADFSFLGNLLKIGGLIALGAIVASVIFGFSLGIWFSAAMIIFAAGAILYDTSNIIHHYPTNRPIGAALHLFSSVMLMLWYVLRLVMSLGRD